jgi:hypothetical protein
MKNKAIISIHAPKAARPQTRRQFGSFLAGLIDGNGQVTPSAITIVFSPKDYTVAYYVKTMVGYGSVKKGNFSDQKTGSPKGSFAGCGSEMGPVTERSELLPKTGKQALNNEYILYRCTKLEGCKIIADLIRGKLRLPSKVEQLNSYEINMQAICNSNSSLQKSLVQGDFDNYWLAGFFQNAGRFQIKDENVFSKGPQQYDKELFRRTFDLT